MAEISDSKRNDYKEAVAPYKKKIEEELKKEKTVAADKSNPSLVPYKKLDLCEQNIYIATLYLAENSLSIRLMNVKNQDVMNDARKTLYKAIIYLEEIVTNFVDTPYADLEKNWAAISDASLERRYLIIRKLGLAIRLLEDALGENSKWKQSFVELKGRFAAVAKNLVDMKAGAKSYFDPQDKNYEMIVHYVNLMQKMLDRAANDYRDRYELASRRLDDMRSAIRFLLAKRRLCITIGDSENAEEIKKKATVWKEKMDKDHKSGRAS